MTLLNWLFGLDVSIYMATPLTGLTGYKIWQEYRRRKKIYRRKGVKVISPIPGEGIKPVRRKLGDRPGVEGIRIWEKDKEQIKRANIFVFPLIKRLSQGCVFELVKARGAHWKPTVFLHEKAGFISKEQSDVVCKTDQEAACLIVKKFGSRWKRFWWRIGMLLKSLPKWLFQQIREFWL